jgi:hypothetical protein
MRAMILPLMLLVLPQEEPIDAVSLALAQGIAAEAANDSHALLAAAQRLEALGARASGGAPSVPTQWRALAGQRGVRSTAIPYRGRALGPAYRAGVLEPGAAMTTEQVFLAGQKAVVALVPHAARTLDLKVSAGDRTNLCARPAEPPRVTCSWLPIFTTRVQIQVVNRSTAPARFYLVSN